MNFDPQFASIIIKLLRGPLYDEDSDWSSLILFQGKVRDYIGALGLELKLFEEEGFAYLSQADDEENIPRLVSRRRLSFEVSLLCVILRDQLEDFDTSQSESHKLFVEKKEIRERIRIYFKEKTDEVSLFRDLDKYINQVENLGFIKKVTDRSPGQSDAGQDGLYEIKRIIKAKIDPDFLEDFKNRLEVYVNAI